MNNDIEAQLREIERLRVAASDALDLLDASLFTNAEHSRAKDVLRTALKGGTTNDT